MHAYLITGEVCKLIKTGIQNVIAVHGIGGKKIQEILLHFVQPRIKGTGGSRGCER